MANTANTINVIMNDTIKNLTGENSDGWHSNLHNWQSLKIIDLLISKLRHYESVLIAAHARNLISENDWRTVDTMVYTTNHYCLTDPDPYVLKERVVRLDQQIEQIEFILANPLR